MSSTSAIFKISSLKFIYFTIRQDIKEHKQKGSQLFPDKNYDGFVSKTFFLRVIKPRVESITIVIAIAPKTVINYS